MKSGGFAREVSTGAVGYGMSAPTVRAPPLANCVATCAGMAVCAITSTVVSTLFSTLSPTVWVP